LPFAPGLVNSAAMKEKWLLLGVLALASVMRLLWLDSVPGLHADEAWAGYRAHEILSGEIRTPGLTCYTGALYLYLLTPFLAAFGCQVWALRLLPAVLSIGSVGLAYLLAKEWFMSAAADTPNPKSAIQNPKSSSRAGLVAAGLLAVMPFHVTMGRSAVDNYCLLGLATMLGLYLLARAERRSRCLYWAAAVMGLGVYCHLLFVALPCAVAVHRLLVTRLRVLTDRRVWVAAAILALFAAPRAYHVAQEKERRLKAAVSWRDAKLGLQNVVTGVPLFPKALDGDVLYQRFCGEVRLGSRHLNSAAFVLLLAYGCATAARGRRTQDVFLLTTLGVSFGATMYIAPDVRLRYLLMPQMVAALAAGVWLARLIEAAPKRGGALLALLMVGNVALVAVNFFGVFRQSGGRLSMFSLTSQAEETSNHFVDARSLHQALAAEPNKKVSSYFFITMPLRFMDLKERRLTIKTLGEDPGLDADTRLVFYAGRDLFLNEEDFFRFYGRESYERDEAREAQAGGKFRVYRRRAAQALDSPFYVRWGLAQMTLPFHEGPTKAVELLKKAVDLDPRSFSAWYYLGRAHEGAKQPSEALSAYAEAAKVAPETPEAHNRLGDTFARLKLYDAARVEWDTARALTRGEKAEAPNPKVQTPNKSQ